MSTLHAPLASLVTPFLLEDGQVRGRVARLDAVAATILARYDYPPAVRQLLGELLAVAALLSASLKREGTITLQIRGQGLVPLMVADAVFGGALRGYAEVGSGVAEALAALPLHCAPEALVGAGAYLAITYDDAVSDERYQGIVGLEGASLAAAMSNYFLQSNQLDAELVLAVSHAAPWVAGGLLIERMPPESESKSEINAESWRYARALAATVRGEELVDPLIDAPTLLYRLFHEEGVRVFPPLPLDVGCRCSRERMLGILMSMSPADRLDMLVDGVASVHCQFCNKAELFTPSDLGLSVG
jgi:molecular chaperone Hsp33